MKILLALVLLPVTLFAQQADPLAVTLANGKTVHFQTAEQKDRFLAAMTRRPPPAAATGTAATAAAPAVTPAPMAAPGPLVTPPPGMPMAYGVTRSGRSTTRGTQIEHQDPVSGNGVGNPSAPMFTAQYYLAAPETWLGKKLTVSAAQSEVDDYPRADGYRQIELYTYNQGNSGGWITALAPPDVALKILTLVGGTFQYNNSGLRTVMFHGMMTREKGDLGRYYILIEKSG